MSTGDNYRTAVVLQGGGALGAYEYGVLKALYRTRPNFVPAVVTGISIGAINASVVVGAPANPIDVLGDVWETHFSVFGALPPLARDWSESLTPPDLQQAASLFGNHGMYRIRPDYVVNPSGTDSIYSLVPLKQTLEKVIDLSTLNRSDTHLVVGALDIGSAELTWFDNRRGLSFEHIIASGSIPPSFPMVQIKDKYYWDGGLFSNTPLSAAINYLEQCDAHNPDVKRELIVVELFPMHGPIPSDMLGVVNRLSQLLFTSKLSLDTKLFAKFNSFIDLAEEIDRVVPPDSTIIREHPGYKELVGHKKIDAFNIIRSSLPADRSNARDFSKASIEYRIAAGYDDALRQGIERYKPVGLFQNPANSESLR
jgi:NTE family protein